MKKALNSLVLAFAILACANQTKAMPVIDAPHIAQAMINTADQIAKWGSYISTFRGYYATFNAVYHGINNWQGMEWLDMLKLTELPYFDNIPGINDIRNIAAATSLTVDELNLIFADLKWLERMANDPRYRQNQAMMERYRLMRIASQRHMRRKMVITQALKRMQQENESHIRQLRAIQAQVESLSKQDPVPTASIMALQAKIASIQSKMQNNKDTLYAQIQIMQEQEEAEMAQSQSELQSNLTEMRRNNTAIRNFWNSFLK